MSKPTILVVTTSYPAAGHGDGREAAGGFVYDFVKALSAHCRVRIVAPGYSSTTDVSSGGIRTWRYVAARPLSTLSAANPSHWLPIVRTLRDMRRAVRQATADGRVAHGLGLWVLPSGWALASGAKHVPYSVWALGSDIWTLARIPGVRSVLKRVVRGAASCHADGLALAEDAGCITERVFDFLPSSRRHASKGSREKARRAPYRLVFLGRWHPNKGIDILFDALQHLSQETWARIAEIHIAGGGPLADMVRSRSACLQADGRPIRISGFLGPDAAAAALDDADFLILPSRIESIPVVFSDAMHFQLPVIATPVGDLPRLIEEGAVGVLAERVDSAALGLAIERALKCHPRDFAPGLEAMCERFNPDRSALAFLRRAGLLP